MVMNEVLNAANSSGFSEILESKRIPFLTPRTLWRHFESFETGVAPNKPILKKGKIFFVYNSFP